ncbi:MAG: dTDP-4-dehydrorhamnose 3,5-epimerase [Pseudomonadota bacterium]
MQITRTAIADVLILEPQVFGDSRGYFLESWNAQKFNDAIGHDVTFVQDNHSRSRQGVLRGLHFQRTQPQGKLVRVPQGRVFDVAVDIRPESPTYGQHVGIELSGDNQRQLWIPPGLAHGFLVLSESADFLYKTTDYYHPASEVTLLWNDLALAIQWPLQDVVGQPLLTEKDRAGLHLINLSERTS